MKLTQKTIEAGDLVVVVEYSRPLPHDTKKQRTEKHKATTEAQKKLNNKTAKGKCALLLAAITHDLFGVDHSNVHGIHCPQRLVDNAAGCTDWCVHPYSYRTMDTSVQRLCAGIVGSTYLSAYG